MNNISIIINNKFELNKIIKFNLKYLYSSDKCSYNKNFKPYNLIKTIYIFYIVNNNEFIIDKTFGHFFDIANEIYNLKYDLEIPLLTENQKIILQEAFETITDLQIRVEIEFIKNHDLYYSNSDNYLKEIPEKWIDCDILIE